MEIYLFNKNGLLTGSKETEKCNKTGEDVFPNYCTDLKPPETTEGEVAVFETPYKGIGISSQVPEAEWIVKKDLRGNYFDEINTLVYFDKIGEEPPKDWTREQKDVKGKVIDYEKKCIREKNFEEKKAEINAKAQREILAEYPLWKQNNIQSDYTQYPDNEIFKAEFDKMRLFINQVRATADNEVLLLENS